MSRRRLFNFMSATSLLLSMVTAARWVRSYEAINYIARHDQRSRIGISIENGKLWLAINNERIVNFTSAEWDWGYALQADGTSPRRLPSVLGIGWQHGYFPRHPGESFFEMSIPLAYVVAVTALLPAWWLWKRTRQPIHQRILCGHCGYDLTGNTSGVCPECGTPVPGVRA